MNKLKYLMLLLSAFIVEAQQLDESFLDSLPEDVREDLIDRADSQSKSLDENYRASQYSSKLQQAEE